MRRLRLRLTPVEVSIHPIADRFLHAEYVRAAYGVHWNVRAETVTLMFLVEGDRERLVAALDAADEILEYDVAQVDDDCFYVYLLDAGTSVAWTLFDAFTRAGLLGVPPAVYEDGSIAMTVVGDPRALQDALAMVPDGVETAVEAVGGYDAGPGSALRSLSDRQREAVEAAVALQYYEGDATVEDLAAELDCARSTAAEHLRKAEGKLARRAVEGAW